MGKIRRVTKGMNKRHTKVKKKDPMKKVPKDLK